MISYHIVPHSITACQGSRGFIRKARGTVLGHLDDLARVVVGVRDGDAGVITRVEPVARIGRTASSPDGGGEPSDA